MPKTLMSMEMPKVGDKLRLVMVGPARDTDVLYQAIPCEVTYINEQHGWYEVLFPQYGIRECYNLPMFDHTILDNCARDSVPTVCIETGYVYPSVIDCARDMKLSRIGIIKQLMGTLDQYCGYHFARAL